jgi:transcriptional regulator with XRE-family HTH domain
LSPRKLGMTIKRLREERQLTQAELAAKAKVHRVYVAQIEARTKIPSLAVLERIARALRVPLTELLG